jgi:hypothetical protein
MRAVLAQDPSDCSDPSSATTPSEVSAPAASSRTRGATNLACGIPCRRLRLRPQGFAPSRRFAPPMACRAYFIPVPLVGLTLRGFQPPLAPCSFSDCQHPQGFCTRPLPHASRVRFTNEANACDGSWYAARPAGVLLARGNRCSGLGYFTRLPASVPPWACPFKASCPSHRGLIFDPLDCVPHALFRFCRKLTETPAPQGSQCEQRRGSLSRHP